jgi:hypothetical protein
VKWPNKCEKKLGVSVKISTFAAEFIDKERI